ncbi:MULTISPECIES: recombinase family protein [unclassified Mesorhizobium]|uniref:recombinase family protein n=1 Tax=unclassified Mesorhizobium TaxID=325217 RepID=UPI000BB07A41|nr:MULTISPECIES: recombinase family protein [unclassified Mesorhizobium]PBC22146.1 resolvase [Mesorhizobium sp. WSM4311]TRD09655.1 recombinase family protein [Mesorhizobium sp. WSM4305]
MKVFGYIRVSTFEQANSGESLETQKRAIEGYAMMKGWTIAETFTEAGVSGSVPLAERPEGQRMLAGIASGDIIITPKLDRMFRNATDALVTLEELKGSKVELHMLDLGGDVCGNGISKLVFTILSAVAENERDRIRERIRDVKRSMASRGLYNGGKRPFGFDVVAEADDKRLVPNEAEQAVIARMVVMRRDGASFNRIGQEVGMDMKTVSRILARQASE